MVTSKNALEYVTSFYNTLRSTLKHFVNSPKSTEILKEALATLEMNEVHILDWDRLEFVVFWMDASDHLKYLFPS